MKKIAYVGIDYHQNSVSLAVVLEGEKDVCSKLDKELYLFFHSTLRWYEFADPKT